MTNLNTSHITIIAHNIDIVKSENAIIPAQKTAKTREKEEKILQKWSEKKLLATEIAKKLFKIGLVERGERMQLCSDIIEYTYCPDCGKWHVRKANLCRDRFCPICTWRLSLQRFGEMMKLLETINNTDGEHIRTWSLVTLTCKNCKLENLRETMETMSKAWNLTTAQRKLRPYFYGWARNAELTLNEKTREVHPHYHVLVAWYEDKSSLMIDKWMNACAKYGLKVSYKAQNATPINHWRGAEIPTEHESTELPKEFTKAVLETFKYSVKGSDLDQMTLKEFKEVVEQYARTRLISYGGNIKKLVADLRLNMEEVADDDIKLPLCRDCGSIELERLVYKWSFGDKAYTSLM